MPETLPPTATGSHDRVRMRRANQVLTINGTLVKYDPLSGDMSLLMDFQPKGADAIAFKAVPPKEGSTAAISHYTDPHGLDWICLG